MGYYNKIFTGSAVSNLDAASYLIVFALLITIAVIDIRESRIPDNLMVTGAVIGLTLNLYKPEGVLVDGLIAGLTAGLVLLLIHHITKGGLGFGDVKLFGCIGIYLGLEITFSVMLIAAVLSGLFSLMLICINRDNKKREIPFAPFVLAGTLAAVML